LGTAEEERCRHQQIRRDPNISRRCRTSLPCFRALHAWRKVIHLQYQGLTIGRLTANFAELMKANDLILAQSMRTGRSQHQLCIMPFGIPNSCQ
jgi:hypothetical protein